MAHKVRNYNYFSHYSHFVPGVAGLVRILLLFLVGIVLGNIVVLVIANLCGTENAMQYATVISYPIMFIPPMVYAGIKSTANRVGGQGMNMDNSNFGAYPGVVCAIVSSVSTLALAFCCDALNSLLPPMPERLKEMMGNMVGGNIWLNILCVSIFAPIFEEWLCRGTVLRGLLGHNVRPVYAILISALFFALIHANPWQGIPAFLLGCLFGFVYYKTGSLKLTMLMHCVNNSFSLLLSRIDRFADMENWMEVLPARQYWLIFAAGILLIALSVRLFSRIPDVENGVGGLEFTSDDEPSECQPRG